MAKIKNLKPNATMLCYSIASVLVAFGQRLELVAGFQM